MFGLLVSFVFSQSAWLTPIPIPDGFDQWKNAYTGNQVKYIYCNKKMEKPLLQALSCLSSNNWNHHLSTYHGCYVYRNIANTNRLSKHAYGLAIDINAYQQQPPEVVTCFKQAGFDWGGDWKSKYDPMHFEYNRRSD